MTSMTGYSNIGKLSQQEFNSIRVKDVVEVFQDYKKSALLFSCCFCDWKCCKEAGIPISVCQNQSICSQRTITLSFESVLRMVNNSITDAIIFGGLEPFEQIDEVVRCIEYLRFNFVSKPVIIYTGFYPEEINENTLDRLSLSHVILKCGRYIPNLPPVYDEVLGITLASNNQYGVQL